MNINPDYSWLPGLKRHLQVLVGDIGERHLGSQGEVRTLDYLEREFAQAGYKVERESFETLGWNYQPSSLALADGSLDFDSFPCFYTQSCDLSGQLLDCHIQSLDSLDGVSLEGRICLLYGETDGVYGANAIAEDLDRRGAAGLIFTSPYDHTYSTKIVRSPNLSRMASVTVSRHTARRILAHRDKTFRLRIQAERFPWTSCNLIARPEGEAYRIPRIIIGAHYDTAPGMPGAADNGSGLAFILEAAHKFKDLAIEHGIHFIAFGGEEFASVGSNTYVERHLDDLKQRLRWMAAVDDYGVYLGRPGLAINFSGYQLEQVESWVKAGGFGYEPGKSGASDNVAFQKAGFNGLQFFHYHGPSHLGSGAIPLHSPDDNLATMDFPAYAAQSAVIAGALDLLVKAQLS